MTDDSEYTLTLNNKLVHWMYAPKTETTNKVKGTEKVKPASENVGDITAKPEEKAYVLTTVPKRTFHG